ncbi:MAG: hypothetical protein R3F34_01115, partial [Planctomycetota bacterium]
MSGGDGAARLGAEESESSEACQHCRAWIGARLRRVDDGEDEERARAHLRECIECRLVYREHMAAAARIGRAAIARVDAVPSGRGGRDPFGSLGRRRGLLVWLAVCAVIFGVTRVGRGLRGDPTLPVQWISGEVWVGGELVGAEFGPRTGLRGDLIQTGSDGRAKVVADDARIELRPGTTMLVESAVGRRVRFVDGVVDVEGEANVRTPFGIVDVDGACTLTLDESRLDVECASG